MFTTTSWNVLTICQVSLLTIQLGLSLISFPICFPSTEISFLQPWRLEGWDGDGAEDQMEERVSWFHCFSPTIFLFPKTMQCLHFTFSSLTQDRAGTLLLTLISLRQVHFKSAKQNISLLAAVNISNCAVTSTPCYGTKGKFLPKTLARLCTLTLHPL